MVSRQNVDLWVALRPVSRRELASTRVRTLVAEMQQTPALQTSAGLLGLFWAIPSGMTWLAPALIPCASVLHEEPSLVAAVHVIRASPVSVSVVVAGSPFGRGVVAARPPFGRGVVVARPPFGRSAFVVALPVAATPAFASETVLPVVSVASSEAVVVVMTVALPTLVVLSEATSSFIGMIEIPRATREAAPVFSVLFHTILFNCVHAYSVSFFCNAKTNLRPRERFHSLTHFVK